MPDAAGARALREDDYFDDHHEPYLSVVPDAPVRRTVRITGQATSPRRRTSPTADRVKARPDRVVLWAFLLGLFLVFMAVATANAATL